MSLKLENLKKSFGDKLLFGDLSYEFENSGIYALVGKSGCGKTTLLRMISGLDSDYEGKITLGSDIKVSYCFQEHRLFPHLTALDNVTVAAFDKKSEENLIVARELLLELGFTEEDLKLKPTALSGGMKQRVAIARAILYDAPILLLDEPTKELDGLLVSKVHELIAKESKKRLVIIVSHDEADLASLDAKKIYIGKAAE